MRHFVVTGLVERLVNPRGVALSLAVIAATLVVSTEGIALRRIVACLAPIAHGGQFGAAEQRELRHENIIDPAIAGCQRMTIQKWISAGNDAANTRREGAAGEGLRNVMSDLSHAADKARRRL